jgi:hypothetical protein
MWSWRHPHDLNRHHFDQRAAFATLRKLVAIIGVPGCVIVFAGVHQYDVAACRAINVPVQRLEQRLVEYWFRVVGHNPTTFLARSIASANGNPCPRSSAARMARKIATGSGPVFHAAMASAVVGTNGPVAAQSGHSTPRQSDVAASHPVNVSAQFGSPHHQHFAISVMVCYRP